MGRKPIWPPTPLPSASQTRGILLPAVASALDALDVNAHFWTGPGWYPVCVASTPTVMSFEIAYGVETERWGYNERCRRRAIRQGETVVGEHSGFHDLFVPVSDRGVLWGMLVVGPFSRVRPTKGALLARWNRLTLENGRVTDPDFSHYVAMTLSALTLEGGHFETFQSLLARFVRLVVGSDLGRIADEADALIRRLDDVRFAERMWQSASEMVDDRTIRKWTSVARGDALAGIGLMRLPSHVVVGLLRGRDEPTDPVDDLLARDAFQRACVADAKARGGVACRRIGDHGVALLLDDPGQGPRTRSRMSDLATRAAALAGRFGLRLHAGMSRNDDGAPLTARYRSALGAAEAALVKGVPLLRADSGPAASTTPLFALRRQLVSATREGRTRISPLFDRYVEAVAAQCGYRLEPVCVHLEMALDEMSDVAVTSGALDERGMAELKSTTLRSAAQATTTQALLLAYRPAISDIDQALEHPSPARQDRGLRRTLAFVRDHLDEPLDLAKLARVAGYAPRHLARLFVKNEGRTPKQYLDELRVARAKQLLATTTLSAEQIGKLTGLGTRASMQRTFRASVGMTPGRYRKQHSPESYEAREVRFRGAVRRRRRR